MEKQYKIKKKNKKTPFFITLIILSIFVTGIYFAYNYVVDIGTKFFHNTPIADKVTQTSTSVEITIPLGSSTKDIANILKNAGVIENQYLYRALSKMNGYDGRYQSGTYTISTGLEYDDIMKMLIKGSDSSGSTIDITIPEGLTYTQVTDIYLNKNLIDKDKFDKLANEKSYEFKFLKDLPERENRLEGYLFPETYRFLVDGGEEKIILKMLSQFDKIFKPEYYDRAKELNMTVDEIITLASIIEKEAVIDSDRPLISSVFHNRLNNKNATLGKLESCATIQYILLKETGHINKIISEKDTNIDNEYNTYLYPGLPPGPICSPGEASIKAALYPADTNYYYFGAKGDGSHFFNESYRNHINDMRKYGLLK